MKEGLKEKGLTEKELDLLGNHLLEGYLGELKGEMQNELESNIEEIFKDIKDDHLSTKPWIVIIHDSNADVGTGIEIDSILVGPGEDIIKEIHKMYDFLTEIGRQGNTIIPMKLDYAGELIFQLQGMIRKIRTRSEGVHNKIISRVSIDTEMEYDEKDDDDADDEGEEETSEHRRERLANLPRKR